MRNMIMCALMFLLTANVCIGQDENTFEKLTVKIYDQKNEIISKTIYENEEAKSIDLPSLLKENQDVARITVRGLFYTDKEVNNVYFDSRNHPDFAEANHFCEQVEFSMKPFLGVGAYSTDDMRGVNIERVVKDGPADAAGIVLNDVITNFNAIPIGTFCDLKLEVAECEVGQIVDVQIEKDGQLGMDKVTIGGQINNRISFVACDEAKPELTIPTAKIESQVNLSVYPNPTNGDTNMKFLSTSTEAVKFYVMDINGGIIHKEVFNNYNGVLNMNYTFVNEAAGNYLFVIEQGDKLYKQQVIYSRK